MTEQPTLDELMLAYDRTQLDSFGDAYQRLLRGGMITMQGVPTQEGERALVRAYKALASRLEARVAALVEAGNRLAIGAHSATPQTKKHWRELVRGDA